MIKIKNIKPKNKAIKINHRQKISQKVNVYEKN